MFGGALTSISSRCSPASRPETRPSAGSRPSAPKKSMATISSSCLRSRATWVASSAPASVGRVGRRARARSAAILGVVLVARGIEQRLHLGVGQARRPGRPHRRRPRRPASAISLTSQAKSSLRLGIGRQRIDGVLHRHRAQPLQPPPDLDPRIGGLGRQLMDQQQPRAPSGVSFIDIVHLYHITYVKSNTCIIFLLHSHKTSLFCHETSVSPRKTACLSTPGPSPSSRRASKASRPG